MDVNVKFAKLREDAKIPSKRDCDMGLDIYACFDEDYMVLKPHETKLIPTGIASSCDTEYGILLRERGSSGSNGIGLRAGVIEGSYRGEWFVCLTNTTNNTLFITKLSKEDTINAYWSASNKILRYMAKIASTDDIFYPYEKAIVQAVIIPVPHATIEEISYDELKNIESERGTGALGSSGK